LERLRSTATNDEVRTTVGDVQQIFHDDPPALFIAWPKVTRALSAKFQASDEGGPDVLSSLWKWRLAEPPQ
jgi:hypothetical protein